MQPILETIDTILNLIQKGTCDYPDELNGFACTLEALSESVKSLDENNLPIKLFEKLFSDLTEARDITKRLVQNQSWWKNIAHYLPGSDIHKLKAKNEQITQDLRLVNVISSNRRVRQPEISMNSQNTSHSLSQNSESMQEERNLSQSQEETHDKCRKKVKLADKPPPVKHIRPVTDSKLAEIVNAPTNPSTLGGSFKDTSTILSTPKSSQFDHGYKGDGEPAFHVTFIYEKELFDSLTKGDEIFTKMMVWDGGYVELKLGRSDFPFLPEVLLVKISREHATILGYRNRRKEANLDEIMMLPTQEETKNSFVFSENATINTGPSSVNNSQPVNSPIDATFEKVTYPAAPSRVTNFAIYNESANKTYVLADHEYGLLKDPKETIKGKFKKLKVGDRMELKNLDIVALRINPVTKAVAFGFQFLCENL